MRAGAEDDDPGVRPIYVVVDEFAGATRAALPSDVSGTGWFLELVVAVRSTWLGDSAERDCGRLSSWPCQSRRSGSRVSVVGQHRARLQAARGGQEGSTSSSKPGSRCWTGRQGRDRSSGR